MEKGDAERDWKIMLPTIQVKYPTDIEMSLYCYRDESFIHLRPLLRMTVCPTGISSANPTSAQTVLTELTVVSMVARPTSASPSDRMTVFVPC